MGVRVRVRGLAQMPLAEVGPHVPVRVAECNALKHLIQVLLRGVRWAGARWRGGAELTISNQRWSTGESMPTGHVPELCE